ncbi:rRNA methyltransferase 1, mitochondrial isoform X2 [Stegostoma tigrinum]|uniref:rRNA methyltransferase 1, mitochondrial isoform X2 n=1 Tax=Stegostoma tigrinum TaxID=3053191 RepID=UPI00202B1BAD|nr:rRNA methyltransferase 1, mitochondrial isoform X2 [Stegostoma tigrinum]XP_048413499.1 rRNA methyltransferase 1, mitochondrial isoform X2 [Stegostoma tigrinum]
MEFLKQAAMSSVMSNEAARCLRRSLWQFSWLQFVRRCSCKREISNDSASVKQKLTVKSEKASNSSKIHGHDFNKAELDVKGNAKRLTELPESLHRSAALKKVRRPAMNLSTGTSRKQDDASFVWQSQNPSKVIHTQSSLKPSHVRNLEFHNLRNDDFTKRTVPKISPLTERESHSEMLFGIAPCNLALSQLRRKIFRLFVKENRRQRAEIQQIYQRVKEIGVPVHQVMRKVLDRLSGNHVHQGICLEVTPLDYVNYDQCSSTDIDGSEFERSDKPILWLALEEIQDPMNMGAVLRSAYFLGADLVLVSQQKSCSLTPTVSKASAGVLEVMTVYCTSSLPQVLKTKGAQGWQIVGTVGKSTEASFIPVIPCTEFQWSQRTILVLGKKLELTAAICF